MIKKCFQKYRDIIPYGIFGILTTVINWTVYKISYGSLHIPNVPSTCIAWLTAVVFAFVTNKLWVFRSKSFAPDVIKKEAATFFSARIATGVLDVVIMWISVDCFCRNEDLWKMISNILVIILNYAASKFWIFNNCKKK